MFFYVLVLGILVLAVGYAVSIWRLKRLPLSYRSGACNVAAAELFSGYSDNGDDNSILWRTDGLFISECFGTKPDIQCKSHENGLFALVLMAVIFGSSYYIADTFAAEYMRSHYEAVKKYPQK